MLHSLWDFSIHISDVPSDLQIAKHINIKTLLNDLGVYICKYAQTDERRMQTLEIEGKRDTEMMK